MSPFKSARLMVVLVLSLLCLLSFSSSTASSSASPSTPSSFPSYLTYAGRPYNVSYNARSLLLNDLPVLFVSGSLHYPRSTPGMWPTLMQQAVLDGLNMVEVYVFWNFHEAVEGQYDWAERANLTLFLEAAADAGLFVNLRVGPYVCAEWDYGGIPTWLAYKEGIRFRSYNSLWRDAVGQWVHLLVDKVRDWFADRGGPIILAQIENELNGADSRYVEWNGQLVRALEVPVPWIMCNGQSSNNTIETCNGGDCAGWLETNGQSGRIFRDQPALWTENEGLFQSWGDVTKPLGPNTDRTPQDMAYAVARWYARGGCSMNYYMYHGGIAHALHTSTNNTFDVPLRTSCTLIFPVLFVI
jgi:hypothetical protein